MENSRVLVAETTYLAINRTKQADGRSQGGIQPLHVPRSVILAENRGSQLHTKRLEQNNVLRTNLQRKKMSFVLCRLAGLKKSAI